MNTANESVVIDASPFDISEFELLDTGVLTVQNAKGDDDLISKGQPVKIELYGSGSAQAVKVAHKAGQRSAARVAQLVRGKVNKREAENAEEEEIEKLVALTKSISPNFPLTPEEIYSNPKLGYITRQVKEYLAADSNFSKG
ncbi:MAG: hypothetical protein R3332_00460 [Pseudohongiellaceae bacterium]|nr:hypothetical protein [Pseudohongiellaceae bacterium]